MVLTSFRLQLEVASGRSCRAGYSMGLVDRLRKWYKGEFIPTQNAPDSQVVFAMGRYKRHWTATVARTIAQFHRKQWKWAIPVYLSIFGLLIKWALRS